MPTLSSLWLDVLQVEESKRQRNVRAPPVNTTCRQDTATGHAFLLSHAAEVVFVSAETTWVYGTAGGRGPPEAT